MQVLSVLLALLALVTFILPWRNRYRINRLDDEVASLRRRLDLVLAVKEETSSTSLERAGSSASLPPLDLAQTTERRKFAGSENPAIFDPEDEDLCALLEGTLNDETTSTNSNDLRVKQSDVVDKGKSQTEFNIGAKLPVWIGSVSLACAGFYLVKYSIEAGLLGPTVRVMLGFLFGMALVAGGRFVADYKKISNALRVAQGMVGAGLVTLTFSLYSAVHLHHIISPFTGFCGMSAVVIATMVLALRLGPPVALFGMVGGFLAPALFSAEQENFVGLFSYLIVLYSGLQLVFSRQKWVGLSLLSIAGVFIWALVVLGSPSLSENSSVLALFVLGVSAVTLFTVRHDIADGEDDTSSYSIGQHMSSIIAIGGSSLLLIFLQLKTHFGEVECATSFLLSAGIIGLAYLRPGLYTKVMMGKLFSDILLLAIYLPQTDITSGVLVASVLLGLYAVPAAFILQASTHNEKPWAIIQVAAALGVYIVTYAGLPKPLGAYDTSLLWGAVSLIGALYATTQASIWIKKSNDYVIALYSLAATSFLSMGLAIVLPLSYWPIALSLEIAAILWIYRSIPVAFLQTIGKVLLSLFVLMNLYIGAWFLLVILNSLIGRGEALPLDLRQPEDLALRYFLPALGMGTAYILYSYQTVKSKIVQDGLVGMALLLMVGGLYTTLRMVSHGQDWMPADFIERGAITLMIALIGMGIVEVVKQKNNFSHMLFWGKLLITIAIARIAYFDLLIHNPIADQGQNVGTLPLLNGVTLTYGSGIVLATYATYLKLGYQRMKSLPQIFKGLILIFMFAGISLNVRQIFHGGNLHGLQMDNLELYSYSIVWLLTGICLLAYGIKRSDRTLRIAALAFLSLTIAKVFLIDASELEGLYRIFSFFGLGVSLIGLSVFYTRFMKRNGDVADENES